MSVFGELDSFDTSNQINISEPLDWSDIKMLDVAPFATITSISEAINNDMYASNFLRSNEVFGNLSNESLLNNNESSEFISTTFLDRPDLLLQPVNCEEIKSENGKKTDSDILKLFSRHQIVMKDNYAPESSEGKEFISTNFFDIPELLFKDEPNDCNRTKKRKRHHNAPANKIQCISTPIQKKTTLSKMTLIDVSASLLALENAAVSTTALPRTSLIQTQMPAKDESVEKCRRTIAELLKLSARQNKYAAMQVVLQALFNNKLGAEEFCIKMGKIINVTVRPTFITLLKETLPSVRQHFMAHKQEKKRKQCTPAKVKFYTPVQNKTKQPKTRKTKEAQKLIFITE